MLTMPCRFVWTLLLSLVMALPASAGSRHPSATSTFSADRVANFAKKVEKYAASRGALVFLLARLGTDPGALPAGVQFTHVGLAVYSRITTAAGQELRGYAIHNLYQRSEDLAHSELVQDYPLDFFSDVFALKAGVIIPAPALQQKLLAAVTSGALQQLHNSDYSLVSNPFNRRYQNCTELELDLLFAAIYGTQDMAQIKANERAYFKPQLLEISPLKRLFAPMLSTEVRMDDQPGRVQTTTFSSIARFLSEYGLADGYTLITENGDPQPISLAGPGTN